jgi:hypothetical protein
MYYHEYDGLKITSGLIKKKIKPKNILHLLMIFHFYLLIKRQTEKKATLSLIDTSKSARQY